MLEVGLESSDLAIARLAAGVKLSRRLNNLLKIDENLEIDQDYITCAEYQLFVDEWFGGSLKSHDDLYLGLVDPPKSPLERGTLNQLPPFSRGAGGDQIHLKQPLNSGERFQPGNAKKQITGVSWNHALDFCAWLSSKNEFNGQDEFNGEDKEQNQVYYYRLPTVTEAQNYPVKTDSQLGCWHWHIAENKEEEKGIRLVKTQIPPSLFEFETITINSKGQEIQRQRCHNQYLTEGLGNNITLDMVAIPGGSFLMGTEDEEIERLTKKFGDYFKYESPQHKVTVQPFYMSKYLITQRQWKAIAQRTDLKVKEDLNPEPSHFKENPKSFSFPNTRGKLDLPKYGNNPSYLDRPVERINWYEAKEFCDRLSKLTGREYRLPTEAEWEYACRAIQNSKFKVQKEESIPHPSSFIQNLTYPPFYFGETITSDLANYDGSYTYADEPEGEYRRETTPVGQFPPNAFGLYDLHGNVWEWCGDTWHDNYENAPTDGSAWITKNNNTAVLRGGTWFFLPYTCRSALRFNLSRAIFYSYYGFRVVSCFGKTS